MWQLKRLVDPHAVLNPGSVLSDDPRSYLADLKVASPVEEEVDRCVECGYCEPVCPSRGLTTTPRQRIVLRREMESARRSGDTELLAELERDYDYEAVQTCAVDGMCQTACPVQINTGDLVRRLRAQDSGPVVDRVWKTAASHWGAATQGRRRRPHGSGRAALRRAPDGHQGRAGTARRRAGAPVRRRAAARRQRAAGAAQRRRGGGLLRVLPRHHVRRRAGRWPRGERSVRDARRLAAASPCAPPRASRGCAAAPPGSPRATCPGSR